MQIKYLQDAPQGKAEEVVDLDEIYANALIATGFAEAYTEEVKPKTKTTKKTTAK